MDVEHTKDVWIERRFRNLLGPGLASAVQALEQAEAEWPDSTDAALVAAVERVQAIAEHWSTCPKGDYDCHDCNYNRPEAGDLLLEALKLETP